MAKDKQRNDHAVRIASGAPYGVLGSRLRSAQGSYLAPGVVPTAIPRILCLLSPSPLNSEYPFLIACHLCCLLSSYTGTFRHLLVICTLLTYCLSLGNYLNKPLLPFFLKVQITIK